MARETRAATRERSIREPLVPRSADPQVRSAIALLRSWQNGDAEEQRATWEFLKKALDEDRPSYRKLFWPIRFTQVSTVRSQADRPSGAGCTGIPGKLPGTAT